MNQAVLLYRQSCRKCRWLARAAVLVSGGALRRVALDSAAAQLLYDRFPATRGKLALIDGGRFWCGPGVIAGSARTAAAGLLRRLHRAAAGLYWRFGAAPKPEGAASQPATPDRAGAPRRK